MSTDTDDLPARTKEASREDTIRIGRQRLTQVFKYLEALNQHRNPAKRQIDEQPWLLWLRTLPDHPAISRIAVVASERGNQPSAGSEFLLRVRRPTTTIPPSPPAELRDWLLAGWEEPSGTVATRETRNEFDEQGETKVILFDDDPTRRAALEAWQPVWETWALNERPTRAAMSIFERLYELHGRIQREAERLELVVGDGLLSWRRDDGPVHHPILLLRAQLEFEPAVPEFRIVETERGPELYSPLFHSMPDVEGRVVAAVKDELETGGFHPLGGEDTSGFLRALAARLSPRGLFDDGSPSASAELSIRRDPLIFLRARTTGFATAVESVLQDLRARGDLPESLLHIVGVEAPKEVDLPDDDSAAPSPTESTTPDVLLSKAANAEQVRIAQRLDRHGSVVVQGPPGTGKTHTIANLVGHLLAQGQTVLVTAHTTKALRVLREHVVEQLRPLCVAVLESDTESRRQLESAVDSIVHRLSVSDVDELEKEAESLDEIRRRLLADVHDTQRRLIDARNDEFRDVVVAGRSVSPSEAARHVAQHGRHEWIPGDVHPTGPLPLSDVEVRELYATNATVSVDDEREVRAGLPDLADLPTPDVFSRLVHDRAELTSADRMSGSEFWRSEAVELPDVLEALAEQSTEAITPLSAAERWKTAAAEAGSEGAASREVWETLCRMIESVRDDAARVAESLVRYAPELSETIGIDERLTVLDEIITHLDDGGRLNRFIFLTRRTWKRVIDGVRVASGLPTTREHFEAIRDQARLARSRAELCARWDRQVTPLGTPPARELGEAPERACAQYIPVVRECLNWHDDAWRPVERGLRNAGFDWNVFLSRQAPVIGPQAIIRRLRDAVSGPLQSALAARTNALRWRAVDAALTTLNERLRQHASGHPGFVERLLDAVVRTDVAEYRAAFGRLVELVDKRQIVERREILLQRLAATAPSWADAVRRRLEQHGAAAPPGPPGEAWLWRQLRDELDRRDQTSLQDLQERLDKLGTELRATIAELIDRRAWGAQVKRTDLTHRQALVGWLDVVRRIGKGTGKRVAVLRQEATRLMNACKDAVPVWIMPLNRVVENFDPRTTRFDVVIVDEASQSDAMALLALYLGRKAVVVGDHEQVSPAAVGQDQGIVQGLISEHLTSIPNAVLYDGRLSVYDLARQSFGGTIVLIEHFRCVPDIIQFSNTLSYDGKIRPLREGSSATVMPPTVVYRVDGSSTDKLNPVEATTVASLVAAACEQPEYAGASFGVISLVGEEQAVEIERLLRNRLAPEEYEQRRLLCGTAAQFQGDERHVVFLSLVDSSFDGKPLSMRDTPMFRQRFNVAASRARDQLWVVHSLDAHTHLKPGDLRRRLIEHVTDPTALSQRIAQRETHAESEFERAVIRRLVAEGYEVHPQWRVGHYRIDLVVAGNRKRLAVECDGDRYHPHENLMDDLERQAILERLGWTFVRIRGSRFFRDPVAAMEPVFAKLRAMDIPPTGAAPNYDANVERLDRELQDSMIRRAAEIRTLWNESAVTVSLDQTLPGRRGRRYRFKAGAPREIHSPSDEPIESAATFVTTGLVETRSDHAPTQIPDTTAREANTSPRELLQSPSADLPSAPGGAGQRTTDADVVIGARRASHTDGHLIRDTLVCRELAALHVQYSSASCAACGTRAEVAIHHREGVVVACLEPACGHLERIEEAFLQSLADRLSVTCRSCGGPVRSLRGPFGNFLKCTSCGTNSSWQAINERLERESTLRPREP